MSAAKQEQPKLVNHRWQLPSLEQMLDDLLPEWSEGRHPDFSGEDGYKKLRGGFQQFGESLLFQMELVLGKAAAKGISEALALIKNPDYYQTVKRRRTRETQRQKEYREQQERERERRLRFEFTEQERIRELASIAYQLDYHQKEIQELTERRLKVETSVPVVLETAGDDNFWDDTILFDE